MQVRQLLPDRPGHRVLVRWIHIAVQQADAARLDSGLAEPVDHFINVLLL